MIETVTTDVLVIGGGAAATRAALEASNLGVRVRLVDKGKPGYSGSSPLCLKGLVAPIAVEDSPLVLYQDWLKNGCGINDQNLIWEAAIGAPANFIQLIQLGLEFNQKKEGGYVLYRGAGHSKARGLTVKFDHPDSNPVATLAKEMSRQGVAIHTGIMMTKLLKVDGAIRGAIGISPSRKVYVFKAKTVVLACGGATSIYACVDDRIRGEKNRTSGDAFSLAYHAGAPIIDIEFCNFREVPPGASRNGGRYLNALGERFMERYDPERLEKAPRQLMVAAIYNEFLEGRWPIHWEIDEEELKKDIVLYPRYHGKKRIEVAIDFQRLLGGVRINEKGETEVPHLFAAGESAGGLHGGDRLQGTAFLETQIFGSRAGLNAGKLASETTEVDVDQDMVDAEIARIDRIEGNVEPSELTGTIQRMMWDHAGIIKNADGLSKAQTLLLSLKKEKLPGVSGKNLFHALETQNLLLTAEMIVRAALAREESRGSHRRSDFPHANDQKWKRHIAIREVDGEMSVTSLPIRLLK